MKALRILVAEDNRGDVLLIKEALNLHQIPHELEWAKDGAKAIEFLANLGNADGPPCPDLLILDLNLPKIAGWEVLREFRAHPDCQTTPVIVISSSDSPWDRERLSATKAAQYFKKPSDFDAFMRLGEVVLEAVGPLRD